MSFDLDKTEINEYVERTNAIIAEQDAQIRIIGDLMDALRKEIALLKARCKDAEYGFNLIKDKRLRQLYATCLDCNGDSCTHGAEWDQILPICDKWLIGEL